MMEAYDATVERRNAALSESFIMLLQYYQPAVSDDDVGGGIDCRFLMRLLSVC